MVCHGLPTWHLPVCLANWQTRPKIGLPTPLRVTSRIASERSDDRHTRVNQHKNHHTRSKHFLTSPLSIRFGEEHSLDETNENPHYSQYQSDGGRVEREPACAYGKVEEERKCSGEGECEKGENSVVEEDDEDLASLSSAERGREWAK